MELISLVREISDLYDTFLIDVWGTIYDGSELYKNAKRVLMQLKHSGKNVVLFSNYPFRYNSLIQELKLNTDMYTSVFTAGECFHYLMEDSPFKYFYITDSSKTMLNSKTRINQCHKIEEADFIVLEEFPNDALLNNYNLLREYAVSLSEHKKTIICLNPDTKVHIDGRLLYKPGQLALECEKLDCEVIYFGKPYDIFYEACAKKYGFALDNRVLAIGDNVGTDIKGAADMNIDSLCCFETGIYSGDIKKFEEDMEQVNVKPNYLISSLK